MIQRKKNVNYYYCDTNEYKQIVVNDNYVMHMFIHMGVGNAVWGRIGLQWNGVGMGTGTDTMGMEWGWGNNQWGRMRMGTI